MKRIKFKQYVAIQKGLIEYLERQTEPIAILFEMINGFACTEINCKKVLLDYEKINTLWNTEKWKRFPVRLAILVHYKGNKISMSPMSSFLISADTIYVYVNLINGEMQSNGYNEFHVYQNDSNIGRGLLKVCDSIKSAREFIKENKIKFYIIKKVRIYENIC